LRTGPSLFGEQLMLHPTIRAGVALGSNVGDRLQNLNAARAAVMEVSGVTPPINSSPIYETEPVGCEPGANTFFNAVIEFSYDGRALDLLRELQRIEIMLGRPAEHQRNTSRAIDLDLLYFGEQQITTPAMTLPHPRIMQRRFVLQPLADIRPDMMFPGQKRTIRELLASAPHSGTVVRSPSQWEVE
jgi:2-amino-4-hydroxy-6-hydroxymethyldihydropteridine diphosphokinase